MSRFSSSAVMERPMPPTDPAPTEEDEAEEEE